MSGKKKHNKQKIKWLVGIFFMINQVNADTFSGYEQWKYRQEQHDLRLQHNKVQQSIQTSNTLAVPLSFIPEIKPTQNINTQQVLGTALKVNINQANAQELSAKLENIGLKKAQAIVQYREQHGAFKRIDELKNVKGIGEKTFIRNKDRLTLID